MVMSDLKERIQAVTPYLKSIKRVDGEDWRTYHLPGKPNEDRLISVTAVLDVPTAKTLKNWMKNNSAAKQEKTLKAAGDFGTELHELIRQDCEGNFCIHDAKLSADMIRCYDGWLKIKKEYNIRPLANELTVYDSYTGVAGTLDCIALCDTKFGKNIPCILDFKTGFYSVKSGWQMAAYKRCIEKILGVNNFGMIGISLPRDASKKCNAFVYEHFDFCYDSFLGALQDFKGLYWSKLQDWSYLKNRLFTPLCENDLPKPEELDVEEIRKQHRQLDAKNK